MSAPRPATRRQFRAVAVSTSCRLPRAVAAACNQCSARHRDIAEWTHLRADQLIVFVAFAGDQYQIAWLGLADRRRNCSRAIGFYERRCAAAATRGIEAFANGVEDGVGVVGARIVAGEHDAIGALRRNGTHQRAPALFAIAPAAEHPPALPAAMAARGDQRLLPGIGRMCVIDHDVDIGIAVDLLHAADAGPQLRQQRFDLPDVKAHLAEHVDHREQIRQIEIAEQMAAGGDVAPWRSDTGDDAVATVIRAGDDDRSIAAQAVIEYRQASAQFICQRRAESIVAIDDGEFERRHIEQRGLGGTVLLHAAVDIEVIATEIGEDRAANVTAIDTALRQPMRRDFHGAVGHAEIAPLGQLLLQRQRIWRGQPAAADGAVKAVAERTDHAAALASQTQRLRQQLRGAGLAIGAGNTDHTDSAAGVIVETSSDGADLDLQRGDLEYRHGGLVPLDAAFGDHRAGAIGNGLLDKLAAVDGRTRIGEKYVARA